MADNRGMGRGDASVQRGDGPPPRCAEGSCGEAMAKIPHGSPEHREILKVFTERLIGMQN
jgi:hypothetical protein